MSDLSKLTEAIMTGDAKAAVAITQQALAGNTDPQELVATYLIPAMDEMGRRFETATVSCPSC
jgi:methanogenic corrinoid protein MtbC1